MKQATEIERRWLIEDGQKKSLNWGVITRSWSLIDQRYISFDQENRSSTRLRRYGQQDEVELTIKTAGTLERPEFNITQPLQGALRLMWDSNVSRRVTKKRNQLLHGKDCSELVVDEFKGAHDGLYIAEAEFESLEQAQSFAPLEWFGVEITEDTRYTNAELALTQALPR